LNWGQKRQGHIDLAIHNEGMLKELQSAPGNKFLDWRITVTFYVCVHAVDAKLASMNVAVSNHKSRKFHVSLRIGSVASDYFRIDSESRLARYDPEYRSQLTLGRVQRFEQMMQHVKSAVPIP